ncbi:UNVERIFIED_ORG: hypothetical protein J2Y81_007946 [Paraburkholderia sediminicola]|nr:hypothetical protein [Paraburkholderia sediminicola]
MDYRVKTGTKVENISADQLGQNADPEALESESSDIAIRPPTPTQNWAWRSDSGRYDWMDYYTPSFDHDGWHNTSFD